MNPNDHRDERRVAIVTGGATRIGHEIALTLACEFPWDIVVHYGRSHDAAEHTVELIENLNRRAVAVAADLNYPQAAAHSVLNAADKLGQPGVIVNSAAVFDDCQQGSITEAHCQHQFAVNAFAPLLMAQELFIRLPDDATGHVVNLLDWRATRPPKDYPVYSASKAALASLTKSLALQMAPRVQVNAIAPGAILPPPGEEHVHQARARQTIPLQRTGSPHDICQAVVFLLRSKFITGEILHVAGGEQL